MDQNERCLLHLLDVTLQGRKPDVAFFEGVDWAPLIKLAQSHSIFGLILDAVVALPEDVRPTPATLSDWQITAMTQMMGQALVTMQLMEVLSQFEAEGVRAVVLKGIALKRLYPVPDLRTMSDADLLVDATTFDSACTVLTRQGYQAVEDEPGVRVFHGADGLRIELHQRLFDDADAGFLSLIDEPRLFPVARAVWGPVEGGEAWVFPPMEHALFMLLHMGKHMITTGFGLRQLADCVLFVKAYDTELDWTAFWHESERVGLATFAEALLSVGQAYLSLPRGHWAEGRQLSQTSADALCQDLLDAGVFGKSSEERTRSAAVVYRAASAKQSKRFRKLRAIFPKASTLKAPYLYARTHPALLPIAWAHRLINYAGAVLTGKARHQDTQASLQVADQRLSLLEELGFTDE